MLYASARCFKEYDKAIIVSGDGDFSCLARYLEGKGKLEGLMCPNKRYSSLLREYRNRINIIGGARNQLEYKMTRSGGRSVETLGLSGHGD